MVLCLMDIHCCMFVQSKTWSGSYDPEMERKMVTMSCLLLRVRDYFSVFVL